MGMLRYRALALVAALLAVMAIGCGGGDDDGGDKPQAEDVPSGAVAVVGETEVPKTALDRQIAMLARQQRRANGKAPTAAQRKQIASQALAQLLQREAIEQEAAERGVKVSKAEVRRTWNSTAKQQFKTKKALRQFLGGQRVADILVQLRLQVLSERIAEQVSKEAGGGKDGAKAVKEFQEDFRKRWQDKTACSGDYDAPGCS
jgi:SurA-like protein